MILRHVPRGRLAVAALRIVKEQENTALLKRKRLAVRSDNIRSLSAAKSCSSKAKTCRRACGDDCKNQAGVANSSRWPRPPACDESCQQHGGVAGEKPGSDGSFNPRKTTAFLAQ